MASILMASAGRLFFSSLWNNNKYRNIIIIQHHHLFISGNSAHTTYMTGHPKQILQGIIGAKRKALE